MASKLKTTQLKRKEQYERRLKTRLALLAERKTDPSKINKESSRQEPARQHRGHGCQAEGNCQDRAEDGRTGENKGGKGGSRPEEKAAAPGKPAEGGKEKGKEKGKDKGKDKETKKAPEEGKEKRKRRKKQRRMPRSRLRWNKEAVLLERAALFSRERICRH